MSPRKRAKADPWTVEFDAAVGRINSHPLFRELASGAVIRRDDYPYLNGAGKGAWAYVSSEGYLYCNRHQRGHAAEWTWVLAHCLLHLGFQHLERAARFDVPYAAACCVAVTRFQAVAKFGQPPDTLPAALPTENEQVLARRGRESGVPEEYLGLGMAGQAHDLIAEERTRWRYGKPDWDRRFAIGLAEAATAAIDVAGGARRSLTDSAARRPVWERALGWFVSSYPLLGGLAARFDLVADAEVARSQDIAIAAVGYTAGEIYLNPLRRLSEQEWRFVLAHEMLHAALRHGDRVGPRDPYLWNVACDFVINGWLVEMRVGEMPDGLLYDAELRGLSAEAVYDRIVNDVRRFRKLATLRGRGLGDVLGEPLPRPGERRGAVDLDDYYRRALITGLAYHENGERGLLPAGLVQEIRALDQPPLAWDAQLARWFEEYVPSPEVRRTYARPSRRQSATPGIPRPGRYLPEEAVQRCTFGVVLDTSGSMSRVLLGKALGAIASYALARDVPAARVVFCDAAAYDAGYVPVDQIAGRVKVRGRGGTILQPGINLLQRAQDFPPDGPILVITDGYCDVVRIRRDHAFLVPEGARLPFTPRGPVFWMK